MGELGKAVAHADLSGSADAGQRFALEGVDINVRVAERVRLHVDDRTDMQRLTTDGGTGSSGWTTDGRVVFRHLLPGGIFDGLRLMNADGTDETQIKDDDLARLTAAGCAICAYGPASPNDNGGGVHGDAYWQPGP